MKTQIDKAEAFQALHHQPEPFIMPNPWDAGSAKMLASSRFSALATTSAGSPSHKVGQKVCRAGMMSWHTRARLLMRPSYLSVRTLKTCMQMTFQALWKRYARRRMRGWSAAPLRMRILPAKTLFMGLKRRLIVCGPLRKPRGPCLSSSCLPRGLRIFYGRSDLNDTIRRLQAYQEAGADVLYAPGLSTSEDIAAVTSSVDLPVNVLAKAHLTFDDFAELGVKRISVGSSLFCRAFGVAVDAAREMANGGTFGFTGDAMTYGEINAMFGVED